MLSGPFMFRKRKMLLENHTSIEMGKPYGRQQNKAKKSKQVKSKQTK